MDKKFEWSQPATGGDEWYMLPSNDAPSHPPPPGGGDDEIVRLVTAVSQVQSVLGSQVPLAVISRTVRDCNCDVQAAVARLLGGGGAAGGGANNNNNNNVPHSQPSPPPYAPSAPSVSVPQDDRRKCAFCEVWNPAINRKCFVCETPFPVAPPAPIKPAPVTAAAPVVMGPDAMVLPPELFGEDLTKSTEAMLKQAMYEEWQEKERARVQEEELTKRFLAEERTKAQQALDAKTYACGICFSDCKIEEMYTLEECFHRFCRECITEHCRSQINDGNTRNIPCPQHGCKHMISYEEVHQVADPTLMKKFEDFLLRATLGDDASVVWCPRAGCGMAMYVQGGLMLICPSDTCRFSFCRQCRVEWHADATCEQFKQWQIENGQADARFEQWRKANTKTCPKCKSPIEKNGGCNHMTCGKCKHQFCWLCMADYKSGHFSDKGCKQFT